MSRIDINLENVGMTLEEVRDAVVRLLQEFNAHIHDGYSSKSFETLKVQSLVANVKIVGGALDIGGQDTSSFHVDADGNMWLGASTLAAAPFYVTKDGSAKVKSLERNDFHWFTFYESLDGFGTAADTGGSVTMSYDGITLVVGGATNRTTELQKTPVTLQEFTWAKDRKFKTVINFTDATLQTIYITTGPAQSTSPITQHFGFKIVNNAIYGTCADGSTQTLTASLGTFSAGGTKTLEAKFFTGSRVEFYIGGVLVGTSTTNIPTGGTTFANYLLEIFAITNENATKTLKTSYWDSWQAG